MADDLVFEFCDASSATPPDGWADAVRAGALHPVWDWSVVRTVRSSIRSTLLAGQFRDGGDVVGLATARLYGLGRPRPLAGLVDVDCVGTSALPGISLRGGVPRTLHPTGPDPALLAAAVRAFESALRREFGRRVQAVAYRQVYGGELPLILRGAAVVRAGVPVAVLHNRFADYGDYLRTLSKSRRNDQKRLHRNIDADPSVTVYCGLSTGANVDVDAFARLATETARRNHRTRWPPLRLWPRAMYPTMLALPGVEVISYTDRDGGLVAASLVFDHPVGPVLGPWGARSPGPDRRTGLWFDHLGRLIRRGIETGRPVVIGGKGHAQLKSVLGFQPEPQWTVLRRLAG